MSTLSSSARIKALSFVVAGKSAKQLEEWLKLYDAESAARLKGKTDRYPFMVAVEDRQAELKKVQNEKVEEEEEEEAPAKTTGKRKVEMRHATIALLWRPFVFFASSAAPSLTLTPCRCLARCAASRHLVPRIDWL